MNKLITLILVCCFAFNLYAEQLPAKQFSHPERIRYDQHCFTIEGRDIFILSAAFHYFRVPQELWRDRFRKIKEAGFNTVETYVPWNWHERTMPRNVKDYSQCDFDDLKAWLKMAHEEFGLYTIVRPGPFICAEWAGGGYPRWVAKFCPAKYDTSFWLRSNHPEHMKWTKHWYDAVCPVFAEEQLTRKKSGEKGIIMVQLENEYIYFGMESEKKEEVLRDMAAYCTNNGIEVPLFTCVTPEVRGSKDAVISQLFDMDNQYVWWNIQEAKSRIEDLKRQQPNAPAFVCELQGVPQHPHGLCSGLHAPDSVPVLSGNCRSAAPRTLPHHDRRDHQRGTGLCTYRILRSWHCRSCPGYRTRPDGTGPGRTGLFSESETCSSSDSLHHAHKRTDPSLLQRFL